MGKIISFPQKNNNCTRQCQCNHHFSITVIFILETILSPDQKPSNNAGTNNKSVYKLDAVIFFQNITWKGSLKRLITKNNQAAVPIKLFLGIRIAKK